MYLHSTSHQTIILKADDENNNSKPKSTTHYWLSELFSSCTHTHCTDWVSWVCCSLPCSDHYTCPVTVFVLLVTLHFLLPHSSVPRFVTLCVLFLFSCSQSLLGWLPTALTKHLFSWHFTQTVIATAVTPLPLLSRSSLSFSLYNVRSLTYWLLASVSLFQMTSNSKLYWKSISYVLHWGCTGQCIRNCWSQACINGEGCVRKGIWRQKPNHMQIIEISWV